MSSSHTAQHAVLVGREHELRVLDDGVADAVAGRGGLVFVTGEPGIGKSRLVEEAGNRARRRGCRVVWGRCRETEGAPAFWPWTQVLHALLPAGGPAVSDDLEPLMERRSPAPRQADRFRLFDAVLGVLCERASGQPLVLVFDDLHRADTASLHLLDFVAPSVRDAPLLVVGTFRDTEVPPSHVLSAIVGEHAGAPGTTCLRLDGLTSEGTAALVEALAPSGARLALADLQRRSDGNPFFLTQLLRLPPEDDESVPSTVSAALSARVRRLPESTQRLLVPAAVMGRDFALGPLGVLEGLPAAQVEAQLGPAVLAGLVHPGPPGGPGYRFTHVLVRDALYASIPPAARAALHGRVLAVLSEAPDEVRAAASDLASHAVRSVRTSDDRRRALHLTRSAAAEARDRLAHEEAAEWLGRALELGPKDPEERFGLLVELGASAGRASRVDQARSAFDEAWQMAVAHGWNGRLAEVALGLGALGDAAGTVDADLVGKLEQSLERADPADRSTRIRLTARLAVAVYWGPRLPEARRLASYAVAAARRLGDRSALAVALGAQQYAVRGPGRLAERVRLGEEFVSHARALGDEQMEIQARRMLLAERWQADPTAVSADLSALDVLAERTRRPLARWYVMVNEVIGATLAGCPETAMDLVERTEAFGRRIGAHPAAMYAVAQRFFLLRECGRGAEVEEDLRAMVLAYPRVVGFRCMLALLLAEAERRAEAEALLSGLVAEDCRAIPVDTLWLGSVAQLVLTAARLGRPAEAAILHRLLVPHAGAIVFQGVVVWWGAVDHFLGLAAETLGRPEEAEQWLSSGLRQHRAWAAVPWVQASLDALEHLRQGPAGRAAPLTDREREVLRLLADGAANKQIGRRLGISVHTVERHVTNLYSKIGARNRAEATAFAVRLGNH